MKKQIKSLLEMIAQLEGKATSKDEAISKGLNSYYVLDLNSLYGGYRIADKQVCTGTERGTFGESSIVNRRTAKEMYSFLSGILTGMEYNKQSLI
jgi:hypothetical protein